MLTTAKCMSRTDPCAARWRHRHKHACTWVLVCVCARVRPGKLPPPPKLMLVNIEDDPGEKTDRSSQDPAVVQKLKAAHDDWAASLR